MATSMSVDKPKAPKLDVDQYLTTALSSTPQELHPFFEAFNNLYNRKYVVSLKLSLYCCVERLLCPYVGGHMCA